LFLVIEEAIKLAARTVLFEFNDEFTRNNFKAMVDPYLRDIQSRRGIIDFLTVCDETNNTPQVIDNNEFRADFYIKPARSINFITLTFIATRTGVDFNEIVGRAG
jgi:phage tail sheath protein FI